MKKGKKPIREMKKLKLFFRVLAIVLGVGSVGMWILAGIKGLSNGSRESQQGIQIVVFDDIFSSLINSE